MTDRRHLWLRIDPVDALFLRGGHPFGPASRAVSELPGPQVLAGALRTELLRRADVDLKQLAAHILKGERFCEAAVRTGGDIGSDIGSVNFQGPYFGSARLDGKTDNELLYTIPATLQKAGNDDNSLVRLDPLAGETVLPGWSPPSPGMVPLWHRSRKHLKPFENSWMTATGMTRFLSGTVPEAGDLVSADTLYGFDNRTGIAVDAKRHLAADGMIYATRRLVLRSGVCLWAKIEGPSQALDLLGYENDRLLLSLGGEGRLVAMTLYGAQDGPVVAQAATPSGPDSGRLLVLIAPALLSGWKPRGVDLLAAAVPGHVAVSGWDLARGSPKPTRFAVRAGSVYFLPPGAVGPPGRGLGDDEDTALGWGDYCEGVWHHA